MLMANDGTMSVGNCNPARRRRLLADGSYEEVDEASDPDEGLRAKVEELTQSNDVLKAKLERMEKLLSTLLSSKGNEALRSNTV